MIDVCLNSVFDLQKRNSYRKLTEHSHKNWTPIYRWLVCPICLLLLLCQLKHLEKAPSLLASFYNQWNQILTTRKKKGIPDTREFTNLLDRCLLPQVISHSPQKPWEKKQEKSNTSPQ